MTEYDLASSMNKLAMVHIEEVAMCPWDNRVRLLPREATILTCHEIDVYVLKRVHIDSDDIDIEWLRNGNSDVSLTNIRPRSWEPTSHCIVSPSRELNMRIRHTGEPGEAFGLRLPRVVLLVHRKKHHDYRW